MKMCQGVTVRRLLSVSLPGRLNPNLILTHSTSIEEPVEKVEKGHFKMMMMMVGQTICQYTAETMNWLINPI